VPSDTPDSSNPGGGSEDAVEVSTALLRAIAHTVAYRGIARGILHEARNPLQSIVFAAQALGDDPTPETQARLSDMIARGAERVLAAIDDLTHLYDHPESTDAPVVLRDIIERVVALQNRSQLQIVGELLVDIPSDLPPVKGSPQVIEDSLCILLSVAKETVGQDQQGEVRLVATARDDKVVLAVSDTGARAPDPVRRSLVSLLGPSTTDEFNAGVAAANKLMATEGGVLWIDAIGGGDPRGVLTLPRWK
jgi:nitrogen-specific signal transduction histidine kinase